MSFTMDCPHCMKTLNVTEKAFGKTVPCPSCNQPIDVPQPPQPSPQANRVGTPLPLSEAMQNGHSTPDSAVPLPPRMPSIPDGDTPAQPPSDPWAFLTEPDTPASPPIAPPPIPDDAEVDGTSSQHRLGVDVLAGYHRRSKPAGAQIKERLKHGVNVVRKRGAALKLQHEVKSLQTAIDGQFEILGTLALTHRPPTVDMRVEIAELSHIQDELARKETTIESLRQTKGGGSAVKELKQEASQLRNCQQALMIAIGKKAAAERSEMPGAAGAYAALDRLQSSLDAKQAELMVVQDEIGPLWDVEGARFGALKKPAIVVGVVGGGLILLYLLWSLLASTLFAAGLPSWVRYYVPSDTQAVVYCNMDRLRKTEVFKKLEELLPSRSEFAYGSGFALHPDDVRDVFVVVRIDSPFAVYRTHEDLPLARVVSKADRDSQPEQFKGCEYVRSGHEYVAKTGYCTYCEANSEDDIERILKHLDRKESPDLDENLRRAIETVGRNDYYVAGHLAELGGVIEKASAGLEEMSHYFPASDPARVLGLFVPYRSGSESPREARRFANTLEYSLKSIRRMLRTFALADYYAVYATIGSSADIRGSILFGDQRDAHEFAMILGDLGSTDFQDEWDKTLTPILKDRMGPDEYRAYSRISKIGKESCKGTTTERGKEVRFQLSAEKEFIDVLVEQARKQADMVRRGLREKAAPKKPAVPFFQP